MAADSEASALGFEDYSLYSNLSDDELLQLAIERSLTDVHHGDDTTNNPPLQPESSLGPHSRQTGDSHNQPRPRNQARHRNPPPNQSSPNPPPAHSSHNPPPTYSSHNPPREKPPDPANFEGTVSYFMTGSGKRMVAYRRLDGSLVHVLPEPEMEEEPLFKAIRIGDANTMRTLLMQSGINLMLPSKPGWLAIHQAAWFGQEKCLRVLLSAQPGMVNKRTEFGETALLIAVSKEHMQCIPVLLDHGANLELANNAHETPLFKACEKNSPAMVAELLNRGASVSATCNFGWSPLQEAVCRNNVEICEMLLKAGAKHTQANVYGLTPLFTAAQSGQIGPLRLLLKHGADINCQASDRATALYEATKNQHQEIVEFLLSQKADANLAGKSGLLPLHIAAEKGSVTIVSILIPATSKARVRRTGISPLHSAAERNRDDVLETLIDAEFDVNAQLSKERSHLYEDRRTTALYFAVINNNLTAVRMLLEAGADPNLDMFRPLMVATRLGCIETVTMLVEHGADINAGIPTHPTTFPAVYMFSMKYLPMFKYLLDNGGDAQSCFTCTYGSGPHPPIKVRRDSLRNYNEDLPNEQIPVKGVQFCEMISAPSISRWAGPIIDVLLDYVGDVTLCSRLVEHLDSFSDWSVIKEKAAPPRPLLHLCRLQVLRLVGRRRVQRLPLPGGLIRFLQHKRAPVDIEGDCTDD